MNAHTLTGEGLDLHVVFADLLVDSGLLDSLAALAKRAVSAVPAKLVTWLGPELCTPENSRAPQIIIPEAGPWNGIIFIEADDPAYWLLVRASAARANTAGRPPHDSFPGSSGRHDSSRWSSASPEQGRTIWPNDEPPPPFNEPWDRDPWSRGR